MQNEWFIWFISRVVKYQSLLGAMIGSFFAAFIAYRSITIGFRNQKKLENDKTLKAEQRDLLFYKGVLTTIYVNLQSHYVSINSLKDVFIHLQKKFKETHTIKYQSQFNNYFLP